MDAEWQVRSWQASSYFSHRTHTSQCHILFEKEGTEVHNLILPILTPPLLTSKQFISSNKLRYLVESGLTFLKGKISFLYILITDCIL